MADGVLSFPFRIDPQGQVAVTGYGTVQEVDEAIAVTVLTMMGERPMYPTFGIPDPAFAGLAPGDIQVALDTYGPPSVQITSVDQEALNETQAVAAVRWQYTDTTMEESA